ncbi:glutathione S-transferase [Pseudooceanicola sediminis]|uniref:Glutathione S-transferase n=1 Tax=Pseudooceanicola sediminis TaxID=2211117 RepID=A0A399IW89_9RHOB|nr:glutathione S-transferase N-terminal domain-containing protein [Pseudooceanicola sediminis]KAA2314941.1 glutathione S-transferase [Puniceibacterium sp. HSS470]RII37311.1 glutathione S-transferase [Pseudooceanicola sediminis]|tara:strand:- start:14937 stop:15593 length:657 start_codon:yes stop_codon:yes gene_type:complete
MSVSAHQSLGWPDAADAPLELRSTKTSPYGRKARIAALVLGLADGIAERPADTRDPGDDLRQQNPLGKMPCLIVEGQALYDSRVILEYLDAVAGGGRLFPRDGLARFRCLTRACLADGITDAALLVAYEGRFRRADQMSDIWLTHQRGKIERGLSALAADLPDPRVTDAAAIALACALGYLDWRQPVQDWRGRYPTIAAWLAAFAAAEPAFDMTKAPT